MASVLSEHPSLRAGTITFRDPGAQPGERRRMPGEIHRVAQPWETAFTNLDDVDPMITARAKQDGQTLNAVVRVRVNLYLDPLTNGQLQGPLMDRPSASRAVI